MIEIPEVMRLEALSAGLDESRIAGAWRGYITWHESTGFQDMRMVDWRRHIQWAKERVAGVYKRPSGPVPADPWTPQAKAEREKKAREDEEYKRGACTFPEWCAILRRQYAEGVDLASHEERVMAYAGQTERPTLLGYMAWASEPKSSPGLEEA